MDGEFVGLSSGIKVGEPDGLWVGRVGESDGELLGRRLGESEGESEGAFVGRVGEFEGEFEGASEGAACGGHKRNKNSEKDSMATKLLVIPAAEQSPTQSHE